MTKNKKILLGILSIWPAVWFLIFFAFVISTFLFVLKQNFFGFIMFPIIFLFHFLTIVIIIGLLIYYIIHISNNKSLDQQMKAVWIVVIFFVNVIGFPVYWYLNIWKDKADHSKELKNNQTTS